MAASPTPPGTDRLSHSLRALVLGLLVAAALPCAAQTGTETAIVNAVKFALQCHATIGSIDEVALTSTVPLAGAADRLTVRGTYKQKVGGVKLLGMQSADTMGGVFEGVYDSARGKLVQLHFKVSVRTGSVPENCLR